VGNGTATIASPRFRSSSSNNEFRPVSIKLVKFLEPTRNSCWFKIEFAVADAVADKAPLTTKESEMSIVNQVQHLFDQLQDMTNRFFNPVAEAVKMAGGESAWAWSAELNSSMFKVVAEEIIRKHLNPEVVSEHLVDVDYDLDDSLMDFDRYWMRFYTNNLLQIPADGTDVRDGRIGPRHDEGMSGRKQIKIQLLKIERPSFTTLMHYLGCSPWRPATLRELDAYKEQAWDKVTPVAAYGAVVQSNRCQDVACLDPGWNGLRTRCHSCGSTEGYLLAVVEK
jgi:hypothetical protein